MHTHCHSRLSGPQTEQLASDRHAVSEATAMLLVLLATAAILALAGLAIVGVLNAIAWLVAR
jgi:hypothetical protein